jgi:very-short-patch-repair endonuclease
MTDKGRLINKYAKQHRRNPTPAEQRLKDRLDRIGIDYLFQTPLEKYIPDFLIIRKLVVLEVDGGYHDDPAQREYDARRTEFIEACGLRVIRVRNEDVDTVDFDKLWGKYPTFTRNKACGIIGAIKQKAKRLNGRGKPLKCKLMPEM